MEKDALLEIVLHDLKEVETLVQSFKGKPSLSKAFFKLVRNRVNSILDEIEMLEELTDSTDVAPKEKSTESKKKPDLPESDIEELKRKTNSLTDKADDTPAEKDVSPEPFMPRKSDKQKDNHDVISPEPKPAEESDNQQETEKPGSKELLEKPEQEIVAPPPSNPVRQPENAPAEKQKEKTDSKKPEEAKIDKRVLGEKLGTGKSSFNEHIGNKATNGPSKRFLTSPPISDLKKALGINDRFFFQRELFGGNADVMNQTLEQLNEMNGMEDARDFLLANFNWDTENEAVSSFMELIERRYS